MNKGERKKLNVLLHKLCRLRDGEFCLRCGKTTTLQLSHIYPKGKYRKMQFLSENVKLLCVGCHLYWWHKNPREANEWLEKVMTKKRLKYLDDIANPKTLKEKLKKTVLKYELIKSSLEQEIKKYEKKKT